MDFDLPPVSVRPVEQPQQIQPAQQQPPAQEQPPARPAANVPGSRDTVETTEEARRRSAQDAVLGNLTPAQRGVQAARTLDDVRNGIETRNVRLSNANRDVRQLETKLGEQLQNVAPSLTQPERQQYADAYRQRNAAAYDEARNAAQDLAGYTRDNLPRVEQATSDLAGHPMAGAVHDMPARTAIAMRESVNQLDTAVRQSPTGSPELQKTLNELGTQFEQVAQRAGTPNPDAPGAASPAGNPVKSAAALGPVLNQISQDVKAVARRAAGAFGAVSGVLGAAENLGRINDGSARTEHYLGTAASVTQIAGGVMRVAGVAIGGPISLTAGIAAAGLGAVSAYRDRQEYVRDVGSTLRDVGMKPDQADAIARSNPDSLKRLAAAGYTPDQIRDVAASAPNTLRVNQDQIGSLDRAAQRLGLDRQQMTDLIRQMGPNRADPAIDSMARIMAANPQVTPAQMIARMQAGFDSSAGSRYLAQLLSLR